MFNLVFIGILLILVLIVIFGLIKHIFSLFFKIATILLVILLGFSFFTYLDLSNNELIGDTMVIFANDSQILGGIIISDGKEKVRLLADNLTDLNHNELIIGDFNSISNYNSTSLEILALGNYSSTPKIVEGTRVESYLDILRVIKSDKIYFNPKTISLSIIEKMRNH